MIMKIFVNLFVFPSKFFPACSDGKSKEIIPENTQMNRCILCVLK